MISSGRGQEAVELLAAYVEQVGGITPAPGVTPRYGGYGGADLYGDNPLVGSDDQYIYIYEEAFTDFPNSDDVAATFIHEAQHSWDEAAVENNTQNPDIFADVDAFNILQPAAEVRADEAARNACGRYLNCSREYTAFAKKHLKAYHKTMTDFAYVASDDQQYQFVQEDDPVFDQ